MLNKSITTTYLSFLRWRLLLVLIIWLFSVSCFADEEANITVNSATLSLQEQTFSLNADIHYNLSDEAVEALQNGVTLTFNIDLSVIETRNWLWDKHLNSITLRYRIKYHTLAETYQISNLSSNAQHNFSSITAALHALGTLRDIPIHAIAVPDGYNAQGSITAYLNIEALPLPMRPVAYITPGWYLRSDSFLWPLNP
ncbi:MAG TPA: DUF4390 domain-containing protein [Cycloclasticus sp.]|jgi:hypothetical protein|nr:DUF4390 domain-containing protein [Cycloclasticus sp.]HIL91875.1 DUF4390 domain-containing protein [Cycloclasticus sp.]